MATATQDLLDRGESLKRDGIVIRTYDLWKTYVMGDQEIHAVSGVDIQIRRGEYVAIMGPSRSSSSCVAVAIIGGQLSDFMTGALLSTLTLAELRRVRMIL